MPYFICTTCGTQFAESQSPPASCAICEDERQYVKATGQQWTTSDGLRQTHRTSIKLEAAGLISIGIEPQFAIGQRAFFVRTPHGNVLWDCVSLLDDALVEMINAMGGLSAIAISHPHYYSNVVDWSQKFGDIPIYLHADDRQWVMRPDPRIQFWSGETHPLLTGVTLIRCGGHFAGGTVLHWADGAEGQGALLSGDIIQVVADRKHVSFMYSFPNHIPLGSATITRIVNAVEPFPFDPIYGAFWGMVIDRDGKRVVAESADRYLRAIRDFK